MREPGKSDGLAAGLPAAGVDALGTLRPSTGAAEAAATASTESIGEVAPQPLLATRRRRIAFKVAAFLSVLLHAGSLYAFLNWHTAADVGAVSAVSEAISVEIVETKTLEALQAKQIPEPAPAMEANAPVEGKTEAVEAEVAKPQEAPPPEPEIVVPPQLLPLPELSQELAPAKQAEVPVKSEAPPLPELGPTAEPPKPQNEETVERVAPPKPPPRKPEKNKAGRAGAQGWHHIESPGGQGHRRRAGHRQHGRPPQLRLPRACARRSEQALRWGIAGNRDRVLRLDDVGRPGLRERREVLGQHRPRWPCRFGRAPVGAVPEAAGRGDDCPSCGSRYHSIFSEPRGRLR